MEMSMSLRGKVWMTTFIASIFAWACAAAILFGGIS